MEQRYDSTNATARQIIEAEKDKQAKKTVRLREARLAKEAEDLLAHEPGKATGKALKAKVK
jgi:hypothetical protein